MAMLRIVFDKVFGTSHTLNVKRNGILEAYAAVRGGMKHRRCQIFASFLFVTLVFYKYLYILTDECICKNIL
jgi:hypothetical protein